MEIIQKSALLHIKNRRLLCARTKGQEIFYQVGGKPEPGETAEEALIRETREEIRVEIDPESVELFGVFTATFLHDASKYVEIKAFFADFTGTPTPGGEIAELGWLTSAEASLLPPAGQDIIKALVVKDLID